MSKDLEIIAIENPFPADVDLFEWLCERCTNEQTGIIMAHVKLLGPNQMLGYTTAGDVFMINYNDNAKDEIVKITKS